MRTRAPIVQERILPATPEVVFQAWRDPKSLGIWMCPTADISRASVEVDFQVGGRFKIVMHGKEGDYGHRGEYLEIEVPRRLVFTWVSDFLPPEESKTRVTVALDPVGEGATRLVLTHEELPDTGTYDGHESGWATILTKLAQHLEGRRREPR